MPKKQIIQTLLICLLIFSIGFVIRTESVDLPGVPLNEKGFYQDDNGLPYMYELDSYYNYRLTQNFINHGFFGDMLINGENWDLHSTYPPGKSAEYPPVLIYLAAWFYYFLNLFGNVPLVVSCFWLPAVLGPLSGVVAYLLIRRYTNDYGALAGGIFVVTAPFYFIRTLPGWFDTDMFVVLFPLLIMLFISEGVYTGSNKKRIIFSILAAFSMFIFFKSWAGWSYVFYIIIFSFLVYFIVSMLSKLDIKKVFQVFCLFTFFTILFIVIPNFSNYSTFTFPFDFLISYNSNIWPNVLSSVSELRPVSAMQIISGLGYVFFAGILGILWIFRISINESMKKKYLNRMTWFFFILILLWTIIGFFALTKGARFIMILIPPVVVSSGILVGICIDYLHKFKDNVKWSIFKNKTFIMLISIGVVIMVTLPGILNDHNTLPGFRSDANDDLMSASLWIQNNTSNDTVIISEWSYGHFLSAAADHPVSVDGGSQNNPRTYWIYKAFSTEDENFSKGIFNMVATNGDLGPLIVDNYTKNTTKTVEILDNILGVDRDDGLDLLIKNYGFSKEEAQNVLNYTHPLNPRPFVLVTNIDMLNKGYWIYYFGLWNLNQNKANNFTYSLGEITNESNILKSSNGLLFNKNSGNLTWNGKQPYMIIDFIDGKVEKQYIDKNSDFSVFILERYNKAIIMDRGHENSLFVKLIMGRSNSTNFQSIYENKNVDVWKINE